MDGLERAKLKDRILKFLNSAPSSSGFTDEDLYLKLSKPVQSPRHMKEILEEMHQEAHKYFDRDTVTVFGNVYEKNEFTQEFINSGGFVALYERQQGQRKKQLQEQEEEAKDLIIQRKKNKRQARLARWQVITFWPLFVLAAFGGGYSIYQLVNPKEFVTKEEFEQFKKEKPQPILKDTIK